MNLMDKIDSKEKWEQYCEEHRINRGASVVAEKTRLMMATLDKQWKDSSTPIVDWWVERERARLAQGAYRTTPALNWLNQNFDCFAHISLHDKEKVAYTPDAQAGRQDRQIVTTIGKLVAKLMPVLKDEVVAACAELHNAFANPKLEFGSGYAAFYEAYTSSVTSCMVKEHHAAGKYHPCIAYDIPTTRMVVTRDKSGKVNGRCIVREDEKTYIRVYGNPAIKHALEEMGYKPGTWVGTVFRAEIDKSQTTESGRLAFYMPYLDANNGLSNVDYCSVMYLNGKLTCVNIDEVRAINRKFSLEGKDYTHYSALPGQNGTVFLNPVNVNLDEFKYQDYISGEIYSEITSPPKEIWLNGAVRKVRMIPDAFVRSLRTVQGAVLGLEDTKSFYHAGRTWLDTPETREQNGYKLLDSRYYSEGTWSRNAVMVVTPDGSEVLANKDDTVVIYTNSGRSYVHEKDFNKKNYIKLHSKTRGVDIYADKSAKVVKTISGRKVMAGVHDVVKLVDGSWEFSRKTKTLYVSGTSLHVSGTSLYYVEGMQPKVMEAGGDLIFQQIRQIAASYEIEDPLKAVMRVVSLYTYCTRSAGIAEAIEQLKRYYETTNMIVACSLRGAVRYLELKLAEMEAVEAPHRLEEVPQTESPQVEQVMEVVI